MPKLTSIKRKDLIYYFRQLGFEGPFSGGNHQFMKKDTLKIRIPNPHQSDVGKTLLANILRQANVEKSVWEDL